MYVVVAAGRCQGPCPDGDGLVGPEPVGVRHAAPNPSGGARVALAVCGADVTGWALFRGKPFEPGHAASCRRCAQLVAWVESCSLGLQQTIPGAVAGPR